MNEKLIRDLIPAVAAADGQHLTVRTASAHEMPGLLRRKLLEESAEAAEAGAGLLDELADVTEVVYALATVHGFGVADVERARAAKAAARGGFERGLVWEGVPAAVPAPAEPFPIWTVWREEQPAYGYFATEDIAKRASINCWEEDEPVCPDYSWRPDGGPGNWELLVGDERAEVYIRRHLVWGGLPQPPRAAVLTEAADWFDGHSFTRFFGHQVATELRRLAGGAAGSSSPEFPDPKFKETAGNLNSAGEAAPDNTETPQGEPESPFQVWPLARVLAQVRCGSQDWTWDEEWADLDRRHVATGYLDKLEQEIRANGITMPVLIGTDGRLWDGHHRLRLAVRIGIGYVPVELTAPAVEAQQGEGPH